jgi:hypothetical protein
MYVRGMDMYVCMYVCKSALKPESATTREQIIEASVRVRTVLILAIVLKYGFSPSVTPVLLYPVQWCPVQSTIRVVVRTLAKRWF